MRLVFVLVFFVAISLVSCNTCQSPKVTPKIYTSSESLMAGSTVFIIEMDVTCANNVKTANFYAELKGEIQPVSQDTDSNKYQVTFTGEHKNLPAGKYLVRFFDDEGYAVLRKQQRAGEDNSKVGHIFTVSIDHSGVWHGPWVHSEMIAIIVSAFICLAAFSARGKILA